MTIRVGTAEDMRNAMRQFDEELRATPEWEDWDQKQNHKYAINVDGRLYPMKEIISLATGSPKSDFNGGGESIRFVRNLGFAIEALRIPNFAETKAALHDIALSAHPNNISPQEAYDELATQFELTNTLRSLKMDTSDESWFENRIRQARRQLVDEGVFDNRERGVWELKARGGPKFWVEKTIVRGRSDRLTGPHALGKALWSPTRNKGGADAYKNMRFVEPGDIILHLVDTGENARISGISIADNRPDPNFSGVDGTEWSDQACYRIALQDFEELSPPIYRKDFLGDPDRQDQLTDILNHSDNLFFNSKFELNQGAYFTEAPVELIEMLDEIYRDKSGERLPHIDGIMRNASSRLNENRIRGAILLFKWLYGDDGFASQVYLEEERNYKIALSREWRTLVTPDALEAAISGPAPEEFAGRVGQVLAKENLLPWRYADAVKSFTNGDAARTFLSALKELLFGTDVSQPNIDAFNALLMPQYQTTLNETGIKPASHCIPSLALWLTYPDQHILIRPELYNRASRTLTGKVAEGQGEIMSSAYYAAAMEFFKALRAEIAELSPRDMIDVQGFCWGVFSHNRIWFGGKSYGGSEDMLPEFVTRQVYAIGFGQREDIAKILKDVPSLSKEARDQKRSELEAMIGEAKANERKALLNFFDLLSAPGSILVAKSSWFDQGLKQSLLRVSGVCVTENHVSFEEGIGHQVSVDWRSTSEHTVEAAEYYNDLAHTLAVHDLAKALDIISQPAPRVKPAEPTQTEEGADIDEVTDDTDAASLPIQPRYTLEDCVAETGFDSEKIEEWQRRLARKQQAVFQGPPGTGKTFIAERLARLMVSETTGTWDVVQFHPSYSYEDFMQGIRPKVISDGLTYQIEPGRFIDFCRKAEERLDGSPCVLIIDELNRANLSRVFGELMYLLEYRDKKIPLSIGGEEFQIPQNVYLIGTMNTADRSIALVDHALRRRFSFIHLGPQYDVLAKRLERDDLPAKSLIDALQAVNRAIDDRNYEVGISFFMKDGTALRSAMAEIWQGEIEPYLEEYFYDQPKKVDGFRWHTLLTSDLRDWA